MSASESAAPGDSADWAPPSGAPPSTNPSGAVPPSNWSVDPADSAVPIYPTARVGGTTVVPPSVPTDLGYAFEIGGPGEIGRSGEGVGGDSAWGPSMIGEAVGPPSDDHASGGEPAGAAPLPGAAMLSSATAAAPTVTRGRRRHRRMGPVLVGLLVPALMILLGVSLMASSLAGGSDSSSDPVTRPRNPARPASTDTNSGSDDTTSRSTDDTAVDAATTTDAVIVTAAVPVIAVPIVGDPADRAAMIAQTFLTALANEDFRTARAMTDTDVDEQAEQNLDAATLIPVSASQIGPDRVAMRLVIVEYRTVENELTTTFICAQWDVATATGRIDQLGTAPLGDRRVGKVVPGDLGDTLAADCDATAINPSG